MSSARNSLASLRVSSTTDEFRREHLLVILEELKQNPLRADELADEATPLIKTGSERAEFLEAMANAQLHNDAALKGLQDLLTLLDLDDQWLISSSGFPARQATD